MIKQSEENVRKLVNANVRAAMLCTKHLLPFLGVASLADYTGEPTKVKSSKLVFVSSVESTRATVDPSPIPLSQTSYGSLVNVNHQLCNVPNSSQ